MFQSFFNSLFCCQTKNDVVNNGRVNKWAAKALLARVYLFYTGYYNKPDLEGISKETVLLSPGFNSIISNPFSSLTGLVTLAYLSFI